MSSSPITISSEKSSSTNRHSAEYNSNRISNGDSLRSNVCQNYWSRGYIESRSNCNTPLTNIQKVTEWIKSIENPQTTVISNGIHEPLEDTIEKRDGTNLILIKCDFNKPVAHLEKYNSQNAFKSSNTLSGYRQTKSSSLIYSRDGLEITKTTKNKPSSVGIRKCDRRSVSSMKLDEKSDDSYDLSELNTASQKRELCSYLKLMDPTDKKDIIVLQNRRSNRVKNLAAIQERKQLDMNLKEKSKKPQFEKRKSTEVSSFKISNEVSSDDDEDSFHFPFPPRKFVSTMDSFDNFMSRIIPKYKDVINKNHSHNYTTSPNEISVKNKENIVSSAVKKQKEKSTNNITSDKRKLSKIKKKTNINVKYRKLNVFKVKLRKKRNNNSSYELRRLNNRKKVQSTNLRKRKKQSLIKENKNSQKVEMVNKEGMDLRTSLDKAPNAQHRIVNTSSVDRQIDLENYIDDIRDFEMFSEEHKRSLIESRIFSTKPLIPIYKESHCLPAFRGFTHSEIHIAQKRVIDMLNQLPSSSNSSRRNKVDFSILEKPNHAVKDSLNKKVNSSYEENHLPAKESPQSNKLKNSKSQINSNENDQFNGEILREKYVTKEKVITLPTKENTIHITDMEVLEKDSSPIKALKRKLDEKSLNKSKDKLCEEDNSSSEKETNLKPTLKDDKKLVVQNDNIPKISTDNDINKKQLYVECYNLDNIADTKHEYVRFLTRDNNNCVSTSKQTKRFLVKKIRNTPNNSNSIHQWEVKDQKQSHYIGINKEDGEVLKAFYVDYNLVICQELSVSLWMQTPLGNILGSQNMWIPFGRTQRIVLKNNCVQKCTKDMIVSTKTNVAYIELWTKEHKSDMRERPVADIFVTIYFWRQGQTGLDRKVLQLENIKGFAEDVQYCVIKNCPKIVVSWHSSEENVSTKKTFVHIYELALDYQIIKHIQAIESIDHYVSSLFNVEGCDDLIMGCCEEKITLWSTEYGHVITSIELSSIKSSLSTLWVKRDRGFIFALQQCVDEELRLIAINRISHSYKKLASYKPSEDFENLKGVCIVNGLLVAYYDKGILCWEAETGDPVEEISIEADIIPSGSYVILLVKDKILVKHATTHLLSITIDDN